MYVYKQLIHDYFAVLLETCFQQIMPFLFKRCRGIKKDFLQNFYGQCLSHNGGLERKIVSQNRGKEKYFTLKSRDRKRIVNSKLRLEKNCAINTGDQNKYFPSVS